MTWSWSLRPTNAVARLGLPVLGVLRRQYAGRMWPKYAARLAGRAGLERGAD